MTQSESDASSSGNGIEPSDSDLTTDQNEFNPAEPKKEYLFNFDNTRNILSPDRIRVVLLDNKERLEKSIMIKRSWHTPLALLVTILLTFATSYFKDWGIFTAKEWGFIFKIGAILSAIWRGKTLYKLADAKRKNQLPTTSQVVDEIASELGEKGIKL